MKKILLNIGLPMVLALVLQGCTQSSISKNDFVSSNLVSNDLVIDEPTSVHAFVRNNKVVTANSSGAKALEWQKKWKERVAKSKAERKAKLNQNKLPAKKLAATSTKPVKLKGKGKARYTAIIAKYARVYGVPINLAHAVVQVESNYRANARGSVGEIGLMQLRLATARGIGYKGSAKALYNPETNIKFGMKYLGKAYQLGGGSTCGAILKYNAGHGAKRMNRVSANYCKKVKRLI